MGTDARNESMILFKFVADMDSLAQGSQPNSGGQVGKLT